MNKTRAQLQAEFIELDAKIEKLEHILFDPATPDKKHDKVSQQYSKLNQERMKKVRQLKSLEFSVTHI